LDKEEYTHDYLYKRNYKYSYQGITTYNEKQEAITESCSFNSGFGHDFKNLFDGDNGTYAHTSNAPSENNPVVIVAKLQNAITANRIIFDGSHNSESKFLPKTFKVYVSSDGTNWQLVCNVAESKLSSDDMSVTADFDSMATFQYYKVEITATHKEYIALRKIIFQKYVIEIEDGKQITPDDSMFTYDGNWSTQSTFATFGHVYVGEKNATLTFQFEGTRLGILSVANLGINYKVEIDGKEVNSIDLVENTSIGASFVSDALKSGKHTVKITCLDTTNIDSIVVW
jgi:hypothetical protein